MAIKEESHESTIHNPSYWEAYDINTDEYKNIKISDQNISHSLLIRSIKSSNKSKSLKSPNKNNSSLDNSSVMNNMIDIDIQIKSPKFQNRPNQWLTSVESKSESVNKDNAPMNKPSNNEKYERINFSNSLGSVINTNNSNSNSLIKSNKTSNNLHNHSHRVNLSNASQEVPTWETWTMKSKIGIDSEWFKSSNRKYNDNSIDKGKILFKLRFCLTKFSHDKTRKISTVVNKVKTMQTIKIRKDSEFDKEKHKLVEEERKMLKYSSWFLKKVEKAIFSFNLRKYFDSYNEWINSSIIYCEEEFAEFLLVMPGFDRGIIGDFLAKDKGLNKDLLILRLYFQKINFEHVNFLDALRLILMRMILPKDSAMILTIIDEFTKAYHRDNEGSKDYTDSDALYLLSSSILALNTMFSRTDIKNSIMLKKEDFIKINKDCDINFLSSLYDDWKNNRMNITYDYNEILYKRILAQQSQNEGGFMHTNTNTNSNNNNNMLNVNSATKQKYTDKESQEYLEMWKQGQTFLKYGKYPNWHERFFRLSRDEKHLIWYDTSKCKWFQSNKSVSVNKIREVYLGTTNDIAFDKFDIPWDYDQNCFSITTDKRTIGLRNESEAITRKWFFAIKFLIRRQKSVLQFHSSNKSSVVNRNEIISEIWKTEILLKWEEYRKFLTKELPKEIRIVDKNKKQFFNFFTHSALKERYKVNENTQKINFEQYEFYYLISFGIPDWIRKKIWPIVIGNYAVITENLVQNYESQWEEIDFSKWNKLFLENKAGDTTTTRNYIIFAEDQVLNEILIDVIKVANKRFIHHIPVTNKPDDKTDSANSDNSDLGNLMLYIFKLVRLFTIHRPDIAYTKQLTYIAGIFLLNSTNYFEAFINLVNFTTQSYWISFWKTDTEFIKTRSDFIVTLMKKYNPKLHAHFEKWEIIPSYYLKPWLEYAFIKVFKYSFLLRIWDIYLWKGEVFFYEVALGILKIQENDLLNWPVEIILKNLKRLPEKYNEEALMNIVNEIDVYEEFKQVDFITKCASEKWEWMQSFLNDDV